MGLSKSTTVGFGDAGRHFATALGTAVEFGDGTRARAAERLENGKMNGFTVGDGFGGTMGLSKNSAFSAGVGFVVGYKTVQLRGYLMALESELRWNWWIVQHLEWVWSSRSALR